MNFFAKKVKNFYFWLWNGISQIWYLGGGFFLLLIPQVSVIHYELSHLHQIFENKLCNLCSVENFKMVINYIHSKDQKPVKMLKLKKKIGLYDFNTSHWSFLFFCKDPPFLFSGCFFGDFWKIEKNEKKFLSLLVRNFFQDAPGQMCISSDIEA